MRSFGIVLMGIGVLAVLYAFTTDTSVASSGGVYGLPDRTHNLGLMQFQMMVLHTGLASFIAGAVLVRGSEVPSAIGSNATHEEQARQHQGQQAPQRQEPDAYDRLNKVIWISGIVIFLGIAIASLMK